MCAVANGLDAIAMVSRLLVDHGPLDATEIVARLRADGVADPETVSREGLNEMVSPVGQLVDDRWVWLPALLASRVFTHRLTADELTHDLLTVDPDLGAIAELCHWEQFQVFADGSPASLVDGFDDDVLDERGVPIAVVGEGSALLLSVGTLSALEVIVGDLIGIRLTDSGLVIERVQEVDSSADVGSMLTAALPPDEPAFVDSAVWGVCVDAPLLFTEPLPPMSDVIAECGLEHDRDFIAPSGFDIERWRVERQNEQLVRRYEIEPNEASAIRTLLGVYDNLAAALAADDYRGGPPAVAPHDRELLAQLGTVLSDPFLAGVLLIEILDRAEDPAVLGLFADSLQPQVSRSARPACHWLRATALEDLGDITAAEAEYSAAESLDTEFWPALLALARFASDQGDAERGLALMHRAGAQADDPLVQMLQQHRWTAHTDLGRNDACWCGSGRKYKKCHLGNEQLPLEDRAGWLYFKACQHVINSRWRELLDEVAEVRGEYDEDPPEFDDPLIVDAVLFEGGAFEDFLTTRGPLLPDDERLLAEQWVLVDRSVFDVEQVRSGQGFTVRDVRTGDVREVRERTAILVPGQLICTRVLPVGDEFQFYGGLEPVALHERNSLIELLDSEPDPVDLVEFLTRRFAPPTLVNTEGDPLVMCEATVRVQDSARIVAELDGAFDRTEGDQLQWLDQVITHGMLRVAATLTLDGDVLTVSTNSEARMDRALEALTILDPSVSVVDDVRTPVGDISQIGPEAAGAPDDPRLAAALDRYIREYETAWLDESIPALDGCTPRQAADDPTRRDDLIKLLNGFPTMPGGMNVDRLRVALGL